MITGKKAYARLFWSLLPEWAVPFADPCEDPHDTVTVDGVVLDVGVAPLVGHLWRLGIATHNSCQGDDGLYRLYASRHRAEATPTGNPYSAYLTLDSLDAARAVVAVVDPPSGNMVTMSTDGSAAHEWWFLHLHPSLLLQHWHERSPPLAGPSQALRPPPDRQSYEMKRKGTDQNAYVGS